MKVCLQATQTAMRANRSHTEFRKYLPTLTGTAPQRAYALWHVPVKSDELQECFEK